MAERTLRGWLKETIERVDRTVQTATPAVRLFRTHRGAMRAWMRYRNAVAASIGEEEADAYTELILDVAEKDGPLARMLALVVPDHLARVEPAQRPTYFRFLRAVLQAAPQSMPLVARTLPDLLPNMEAEALERFILEGITLHAESHQKAESFLRQESGVGQAAARKFQKGVTLNEVSRALTLYARAHCGEDVQVRPGSGAAFSDGHHIYLPEFVDRYGDERDFLVYRVQTAHAAGYLEYGTFDLDLGQLPGKWPDRREGESELERFFRSFSNQSLAREMFQVLEDARVEARLRTEYPGVARDLDLLKSGPPAERTMPTGPAAQAVELLSRAAWGLPDIQGEAGVLSAIAPLLELLPDIEQADVYEVARRVHTVYPAVESLMLRAQSTGKAPQSQNKDNKGRGGRPEGGGGTEPSKERPFATTVKPERAGAEERRVEEAARRLREELQRSGQDVRPSEARQQVRNNERKDQPRDYDEMEAFLDRNPGPSGAEVPDSKKNPDEVPLPRDMVPPDPDAVVSGRVFYYREWDATIDDYKPRWVVLREHHIKEGSRDFVDEVMSKQRHHIESIRRRFEALRPQGLVRERRLTDGTDLDLERVIDDRVAARVGQERSDRLYIREVRARRDVAVAFLVDLSSSTNELADGSTRRIIDVEKEALIVVAEALNALGDSFAIYGFSGYGRKHVSFYIAKDFDDPYDDSARRRIGRMTFKMENRDGAAIRHATAMLKRQPARTRLLIHISDGKPLDCGCDHYYDRYAQEDTRVALREARQAGIHPFCITVDPTGSGYLAKMFGDVAYTVIHRVDLLPARLLRVYRRLAM